MKENNDINYYEIRVYLIGDYFVGKKAIANRFRLLNCTKTTEDNHFVGGSYGKDLLNNKRPKVKPPEEGKELTIEEEEEIRKEIQRLSMMSFCKNYSIGAENISFYFFPIKEAEPLGYDHEAKEEDEDYEFEQNYHMSLKVTKKELGIFMSKEPKNPNSQVKHLFLYCFDLGDYSSFEKIQIYHSEIAKFCNTLQEQNKDIEFISALIGNKIDQKLLLPQEEKEQFDSFVKKAGMKYYEISTLMFYNFELFFERLFKGVILGMDEDEEKAKANSNNQKPKSDKQSEGKDQSEDADLKNEKFLEQLHTYLTVKPSFSKAKRSAFTFDDNPSPAQYDPNVYEYPHNKEEFKRSFDNNRGRFTKKIFINKQGPIFPLISHKEKEMLHKPNEPKKKDKPEFNFDLDSKKELKEALEINIPGYSLGTKEGKLNLRKYRLDRKLEIDRQLSDAVEEETTNLHKKLARTIRMKVDYEKYEKLKRDNFKNRLDEMLRIEEDLKNRHDIVKKRQAKELSQRISKIKEKEDMYSKLFEKREMERSISQQQSAAKTSKALKPLPTTPGPDAYNLPSSFSLNKGFSFGSRYYPNLDRVKTLPVPSYPNVPSDFDEIVRKNQSISKVKRSFAERFIPIKTEQPGDPSKILDKLKRWDDNRANSLKASNFADFLHDRREFLNRVQTNKDSLERKRQELLEENIQRQFEKDGCENYLLRDINYTLVEEQSPKFSMKGRYEKGGLFNTDSNVGDINSLNSGQAAGDITKASLPNPNFNIGKPRLPAYSFGSEKRFADPYANVDFSAGDNSVPLFENGEFMPPDTKSYLVQQCIMGTAMKETVAKDNGVPGPGYYKLKGFAEEVWEKGMAINEARLRVREKEKQEKGEKLTNKKEVAKDDHEEEEYNDFHSNIESQQESHQESRQKTPVHAENEA